MIEFEWYIKRAKIDLELFFEVENINSDEDLAEYCRARSLSLPKEKYFPEEPAVEPQLQEEKVVVENKPKRTRKKRLTSCSRMTRQVHRPKSIKSA